MCEKTRLLLLCLSTACSYLQRKQYKGDPGDNESSKLKNIRFVRGVGERQPRVLYLNETIPKSFKSPKRARTNNTTKTHQRHENRQELPKDAKKSNKCHVPRPHGAVPHHSPQEADHHAPSPAPTTAAAAVSQVAALHHRPSPKARPDLRQHIPVSSKPLHAHARANGLSCAKTARGRLRTGILLRSGGRVKLWGGLLRLLLLRAML